MTDRRGRRLKGAALAALAMAQVAADRGPALASDAGTATGRPGPTVDDRLRQAHHYLRKGLPDQAIAEVEAIVAASVGAPRADVALAAYAIYADANRFDDAVAALAAARELPEVRPRWERLTEAFGPVRFEPERPVDAVATIALAADGLISPEKKAVFAAAREHLAGGVALPATRWLPFGAYVVNGRPFDHARGADPAVTRVALPRISVIAERAGDLDGTLLGIVARTVGGALDRRTVASLADPRSGKALADGAPELVVAVGPSAAQMARMVLPGAPLLFAGVPQDVWMPMLRRHKDGVTGVAMEAPWPVVVSLWRQVVPGVRPVAVIAHRRAAEQAAYAVEALGRSGVRARAFTAARPEELGTVLAVAARDADAFWALPEADLWNARGRRDFADLCARRGAPCLGPDDAFVEDGALLSVRPPEEAVGARLAELARAVLHEGRPAHTLPIAPPDAWSYVVNAATAAALGLPLSDEVVRAAARVIGGPAQAAPQALRSAPPPSPVR